MLRFYGRQASGGAPRGRGRTLTTRTRRGSRFGVVEFLLELFDVRGVHPAAHFTQCPPSLFGAQRAPLEVDADDAHASSVAGFPGTRS